MSLEDYPHPGDLGWRLPDNLRELKWIIIITQKNDSLKLHSSPLSAITTSYYSALLTGIFSIDRVKNVNFFSFFCLLIPKGDLDTKKTTPNIEVCPESIRAMLEYWYIEHGLLLINLLASLNTSNWVSSWYVGPWISFSSISPCICFCHVGSWLFLRCLNCLYSVKLQVNTVTHGKSWSVFIWWTSRETLKVVQFQNKWNLSSKWRKWRNPTLIPIVRCLTVKVDVLSSVSNALM